MSSWGDILIIAAMLGLVIFLRRKGILPSCGQGNQARDACSWRPPRADGKKSDDAEDKS